MHDLCLRCKCRCSPGYAVAETRAKREQEIALLYRHVRGIGTVHSRHARIALRLCRNTADPHKGCDGRHSREREQFTYMCRCI